MNNSITAKNITHVFKDESGKAVEALKNVSFSVKHGEFFTILGPSGCGKSTLLRICAGMIKPSRGTVEVGEPSPTVSPQGSDHSREKTRFSMGFHPWFPVGSGENQNNATMSMIFQSSAIFPWLTVYQNVEFGLKMRQMPDEERKSRVMEHIKEIGLEQFVDSYPKDLSGGMKQRVGVARALAMNPEILLMDEAFSALDAFTAEKLRKEVLGLWLKDTMTICMVTHSVDEAVEMSDHVLVMTPRPGQVEAVVPVTLPRPRNKRSQEFFALVDAFNELVRV